MNNWVKAVLGVGLCSIFACVACTDSHGNTGDEGSSKLTPHESTETGNPPVLDVGRIALVVTSDEVHIVGEQGAVTPGGIEVEIETLGSGDTQRGPVANDGSFDVQVDGSPDDTYAVRALDDDAAASAPAYVNRGGASVGSLDGGVTTGEPDAGLMSCEQRGALITEQLDQLTTGIDVSCTSDNDCMRLSAPEDCPAWVCGGPVASPAGRESIARQLTGLSLSECARYRSDGCGYVSADCSQNPPLACMGGQCVVCPLNGSCKQNSCAGCDTPEIEWQMITAPSETAVYRLTDCKTVTLSDVDPATECSMDLPCVVDHSDPALPTSVADVQSALAAPDVQEALAKHTRFGPVDHSGRGFLLSVGDAALSIGTLACNGEPDCVDLTYGVGYLKTVLESIAALNLCAPSTPQAACDMPFDPGTGTGNAPTTVWAFHAQTGACIPVTYTGEGGNENRFDTRTACEASCPNPFDSGACPPNRTFTPDACLMCGLGGGCTEQGAACAKLCTSNADCDGEWGLCGGRGFCEWYGCI